MSRDATPMDVIEGRARWCVVCADNRDVLPTLPDKSMAHVITDPPYIIGWWVEAWRSGEEATKPSKETRPEVASTYGEAMRLARRKADEMELELRGMDRAMRSTRRTA